ncbi:mannonate dehydratase [Lactiplantibacillus pentosus]|uniref:mannonate dehydratase n=1 Tax=Lactiplantibacillus pentosus TaxID=1589 RepID=UPI001C1F05DA|nr:mannonate dehydratase [Lactiplantibacillus pentosus]MBU7478610.1 mannonate dehydratase [Lactiplantibacillus pentosus]MBU7536404.1 mannonate dehydratase [Lactiplantibacillus pentosus]MDT7037303.1 mannonate dehydratase [Lactiplantibacillus pentosus]
MDKMGFRWYGPNDPITLEKIRQIPGTDQIVGALWDVPVGEVWPESEIKEMKEQVENAGLKLEVIESVNVHDDIKIGLPDRDKYIENYIQTIRNLSKYGIKVICYNFMAVFDWMRTDLHYQLTDGSRAMRFQNKYFEGKTPEEVVDDVQKASGGYTMAGWEPERLAQIKELFKRYKGVDEEKLTENLKYFLDAIIPVCEECDVRMAMHPDDPPYSIMGLPRIYKNAEDMRKILALHDSYYNGFTICAGSLGENPKNDVPAIMREFVQKNRVPFVHLRNIKFENDKGDFHETNQYSGQGSLDIYEIVKALYDCHYDGYVRPDHGRDIWGEQGVPGYGLYDRALGIDYLHGLWEAIDKDSKKD